MNHFDDVELNEQGKAVLQALHVHFTNLKNTIELLIINGLPKVNSLARLEETYMWCKRGVEETQ